jgi:hypothetical protein
LDRRWHGAKWSGWDPPFHLWHFSPNTAQRLCKAAGFRTVKTENSFFNPISHIQIGRKVGDLRADIRSWALKTNEQEQPSAQKPSFQKGKRSHATKLLASGAKRFFSERDMQVWAIK